MTEHQMNTSEILQKHQALKEGLEGCTNLTWLHSTYSKQFLIHSTSFRDGNVNYS